MESQLIIPIITGITAALVGLGLGKLIFSKNSAAKVEEARKQAEQILNDAQFKAENLKKEKLSLSRITTKMLLKKTEKLLMLKTESSKKNNKSTKRLKPLINR
jgi:ribonuclease Y